MKNNQLTFYEFLCSISVVFIITLALTFIVFPFVAIDASPGQMIGIAAIFTLISTIRDYSQRRFFNDEHLSPKH